VHLVGFIIRIYHDAWSHERKKNAEYEKSAGSTRGLMTGVCGPGDEPCNSIKAGNLLTKWQGKLYKELNDYFL
jgi:hypothetical protein